MFRACWLLTLAPLLSGGCLRDDRDSELLPTHGFGPVVTQNKTRDLPTDAPPATQEAALRVNRVGLKLVDANPNAGLRPLFRTVGVAEPEIFHRGTSEIFVTEGLIRQCNSDGQLAAVIALEMGKMVSEREAMAGPGTRQPDRLPPPEVRVGPDSGGTFGSPDATRLAELSKFEAPGSKASRSVPLPPPDPTVLARGYLEKANHSKADLDAVQPILKQAHENMAVEKQLKGAAELGKPVSR